MNLGECPSRYNSYGGAAGLKRILPLLSNQPSFSCSVLPFRIRKGELLPHHDFFTLACTAASGSWSQRVSTLASPSLFQYGAEIRRVLPQR